MSRFFTLSLLCVVAFGTVNLSYAKRKTERQFEALVAEYVQKVTDADWKACASFHDPADLDSLTGIMQKAAGDADEENEMMMAMSMFTGPALYQMVLTQFLESLGGEEGAKVILSFALQSSTKPVEVLGVMQNDDELYAVCRLWNNPMLPDQPSIQVISGSVGDDDKLYIDVPPIFNIFMAALVAASHE